MKAAVVPAIPSALLTGRKKKGKGPEKSLPSNSTHPNGFYFLIPGHSFVQGSKVSYQS